MEGKEKEGEELRKRADPLNINSGYGSGTAPSLRTTSRCRHLSTLTLSSCFFQSSNFEAVVCSWTCARRTVGTLDQ